MSADGPVFIWRPEDFLTESGSAIKFGLLVLNQPILGDPVRVESLWKRASVRVAVDGGSDRWLQFCQDNEVDLHPDLITGDLDSVRKETLEFYQRKGTKVIQTPDQDETDFTKALKQTALWFSQNKIKPDAVISLVETSGRIDQIMANINTLFKSNSILDCPVFQLASNSMSWLLKPGYHQINIPKCLSDKVCSLVPIGGTAKCVSSSGLKWDLDKQEMKFGELISTSNTYSQTNNGVVTVITDSMLFWSMELK